MKKIILSFLMVAACVTSATAQPAYSRGYENRTYSVEQMAAGRYLGAYNLLDVWVLEGKKNVKQVVCLDRHLEPVAVVNLPHSNNLEVVGATLADADVAVLLSDRTRKNAVSVLCTHVDLVSNASDPYDTVMRFDLAKKETCNIWSASSPDGKRLGVVAIAQQAEAQLYRSLVTLFDNRAVRLWEKEFAFGTMHEMQVTNDGRVVTFGIEPNEGEVKFVVNVVTHDNAITLGSSAQCDPIREIHLLNVIGNHAIAIGTYQPTGVKNASSLTAGLVGLDFNLDATADTRFSMRSFQNEEMNIFMNQKTKKVQKVSNCDRMIVLATAPTSYGAAIALTRLVRTEITGSGTGTIVVGQQTGISVATFDTTGRFRWVRNIRRLEEQKKGDEPLCIGLVETDGKLQLLATESPRQPAVYDIANPAKRHEMGSKGNIVLYSINPEGETNKLVVEGKTKHGVMRAERRQDGTLVIITNDGKYIRAAEMMFQY